MSRFSGAVLVETFGWCSAFRLAAGEASFVL